MSPPEIPAQPDSTSPYESQSLGSGSCGFPFPFPPFQGVLPLPPRSQVLNSPGKASHILRAGVQVYLRRGKCYYGNYNSFTKQSVAVSIQDHKNAHQLNSFLLGAFQAMPEAGRHQGTGVRPSNWVTLHPPLPSG